MGLEKRMTMIIVPPFVAVPTFDARARERDFVSVDDDVEPNAMLDALVEAYPDVVVEGVGVMNEALRSWYERDTRLKGLYANVETMVQELSYERAIHRIVAGVGIDDQNDIVEESRYDVLEDLLCGTLHAIARNVVEWPGIVSHVRFDGSSIHLGYQEPSVIDEDSVLILEDRFRVAEYEDEFPLDGDVALEHYVIVPDRSEPGYGPLPVAFW